MNSSLMTPLWPGTNLTSWHNHECYGNVTLCLYAETLCTVEICDLTLAEFLYVPSLAGNALYAAIFGVLLIAQIGLGIRYKTWGFMAATSLGLITEIIGYIGRIMQHNEPFHNDPFLIYIVCLTIAPAFLAAAIYLCLARIVVVYGEELSRFRPRTYTLIFCSCDLLSLVLQAAGGGIASSSDTAADVDMGVNIMLAGLSFQVFSLVLFIVACAEFFARVWKNRFSLPSTHAALHSTKLFKAFLISLALATLFILIRSVFRVAELSQGFNSALANDEITFMILEGAMIVLACLCMTFLHPGICFKGAWDAANFGMRGRKLARGEIEKGARSASESVMERGDGSAGNEFVTVGRK